MFQRGGTFEFVEAGIMVPDRRAKSDAIKRVQEFAKEHVPAGQLIDSQVTVPQQHPREARDKSVDYRYTRYIPRFEGDEFVKAYFADVPVE